MHSRDIVSMKFRGTDYQKHYCHTKSCVPKSERKVHKGLMGCYTSILRYVKFASFSNDIILGNNGRELSKAQVDVNI